MALADAAKLVAVLELQDKFSRTAQSANAELNKLEGTTGRASGGFGRLSGIAAGAGGALSTFKSRIGGIISGPLGLLGLGAGLFSVGHFLTAGVDQAKEFGTEVLRLSALTGLDTGKTSELAAAFEHFGIAAEDSQRVAGFAEKNLFKLGGTTEKAKKFLDTYGLALTDSAGNLKDFNTILLDSADFFNNQSIPAQQKAAGLAAIYGKSWQTLIPILSAGRDTIASVEVEAAKLGLTLTDQNLKDLVKLRDSTRDWTTALGGLKLQIGLALVPALTGLTTAATDFLRNGGREQIVGFFKNLISFGQQAAGVVKDDVIPVFKGIYGAWQSVPGPLRDLIIKGFAADRTIKFLFGFSPASLVIDGLKQLIGSKFIPQLVTVTNPGFGVPAGGAPTVAAAAGRGVIGTVTSIASKVFLTGIAVEAGFLLGSFISNALVEAGIGGIKPAKQFEQAAVTSAVNAEDVNRIVAGINSIDDQLRPSIFDLGLSLKDSNQAVALALDIGGVRTDLEKDRQVLLDQLTKQGLTLDQAKRIVAVQERMIARSGAAAVDLAHRVQGLHLPLGIGNALTRSILNRGAEQLGALHASLATQRGIENATRATAAKNFSPTVNVRVTTNTSVSVSNVVRTINSYTAAIGSGPGGAVSNPY